MCGRAALAEDRQMSMQTRIDSNEFVIGGKWSEPQGSERISVIAASTREPVVSHMSTDRLARCLATR
jgi:hypothetical protein